MIQVSHYPAAVLRTLAASKNVDDPVPGSPGRRFQQQLHLCDEIGVMPVTLATVRVLGADAHVPRSVW